MTKADSVLSTHRETASKINRAALMTRAWAIFRLTYRYPQIKFSDIGRKCFAWALKQAWIEAKATARLSALTPAAKADRIETLQSLIGYAAYIDSAPSRRSTLAAYRDEIAQLSRKEVNYPS
jgi:hypothetical protein